MAGKFAKDFDNSWWKHTRGNHYAKALFERYGVRLGTRVGKKRVSGGTVKCDMIYITAQNLDDIIANMEAKIATGRYYISLLDTLKKTKKLKDELDEMVISK